MPALDDLVKSLQTALSSVEATEDDAAQAQASAVEAGEAAAGFGRESDVIQVNALRSDIDQQRGVLGQARQELDDLLQRAVALQGGGT